MQNVDERAGSTATTAAGCSYHVAQALIVNALHSSRIAPRHPRRYHGRQTESDR